MKAFMNILMINKYYVETLMNILVFDYGIINIMIFINVVH